MHEAAQRVLDEIEDALEDLPHHDDIVRLSLRAQFLVEHEHVTQEEMHAAIWRGVEASGYLQTHEHREIERVLQWAERAVTESIIVGDDYDELAIETELYDELDAFEDEEGESADPSPTVETGALAAPTTPSLRSRLVRVGDVDEYVDPEWWTEPWLPKGHLVQLAGEGGIGKGLLSISFTVDVVKAGGSVLWLSTEDDRNTLKGRMEAAGCKSGCDDVLIGDERWTQRDVMQVVREEGIDVVFLDAGRDYTHMSGNGSTNADEAVRPGLLDYRQLAMDTGCTIVYIHHTAKYQFRGDGSIKAAEERFLGAGAFRDVPRHALLIARNGEDEMAVGVAKTNMAERYTWVPVNIRDHVPDGTTLDEIAAAHRHRLVYMERGTDLQHNYGEWLARMPAKAGPINRDDEVLEIMRSYGTAGFQASDKLAALHQADTGITPAQFKQAYIRLKEAGTIVYNERKKKWYVTEG